MRRLIFSIIVVSLLLLVTGQAFAFQNEPDGFRGIKWGTSISSLKTMMQLENIDQPFSSYEYTKDNHMFGKVKLDSVRCIFQDGKLITGTFEISGYQHTINILNELKKKYGPGKPGSNNSNFISWEGLKTNINFLNFKNSSRVIFRSVEMINSSGYFKAKSNSDSIADELYLGEDEDASYYLAPKKIVIIPTDQDSFFISFWYTVLLTETGKKSIDSRDIGFLKSEEEVLTIRGKAVKHRIKRALRYKNNGYLLEEEKIKNSDFISIVPGSRIDNIINATIDYCLENNLIPKE